MPEPTWPYVIVGGGVAAAGAVRGIREKDPSGPILLIGQERHLPYDRPPLSKKLWFGKKKVEDIFVQPRDFYDRNGVTLRLGTRAVSLDPAGRTVTDQEGRRGRYERLLLATGGTPRRLSVPGGELPGIYYYRFLDDYLRLNAEAQEGRTAVVVGGGFVGPEIAAALTRHKVKVTMIFLDPYLCSRVFPESLGRALGRLYEEHGITLRASEKPSRIERSSSGFVVRTESGPVLEADLVVAGVGIEPRLELAAAAGLQTGNGVVVDEFLRTSDPRIYCAGDPALFPYRALGREMRVEHWDNAVNQGHQAGRNMAGADEPFTYMPYFFSDLFEFGYEAVGEVDSSLETFADWRKDNDTGVVYYLKDGRVRGAMMCNVWDKVEAARGLIREGKPRTPESLRGAIA
jgi:3-phenylpropionate/trans-cinnamate dioxygenase ferredoxin reductase subunit